MILELLQEKLKLGAIHRAAGRAEKTVEAIPALVSHLVGTTKTLSRPQYSSKALQKTRMFLPSQPHFQRVRNFACFVLIAITSFSFQHTAAETPQFLPLINSAQDLQKLKPNEEFIVHSKTLRLNAAFISSSDSQTSNLSTLNELLGSVASAAGTSRLLLSADNSLLDKCVKFSSAFLESQQAVDEDDHYRSLLPISHSFFRSWFLRQAYDETDSDISLPDIPTVAFDYLAKCRLLQNDSNDEVRCKVLRIIVTPTPTPLTVDECRQTLALPSICIDETKTFKTYLSNLHILGKAGYATEASRAINGQTYNEYLSLILMSDEKAIQQINLQRYMLVKEFSQNWGSDAPSWDNVFSVAKSICETESLASQRVRYLEDIVEKRFLRSVQALFIGSDRALTTFETEKSVITFFKEKIEPDLFNYFLTNYLSRKTLLCIDHRRMLLVDGATALEVYIRAFHRLPQSLTPIDHRKQVRSLQEEFLGFAPVFPQPSLPAQPHAPEHPSITNLRKLGLSPGELEKVFGDLEDFYTNKAMSAATGFGTDAYLDKLVELGKSKAQILSAIEPTASQLNEYRQAVAAYEKAHAKWKNDVEKILFPWRARNLNVQTSWLSRKLVANSFLDKSLRSKTRFDKSLRRQKGLDFSGRDHLPTGVLLPDINYFLPLTVEDQMSQISR